VRVVLLAPQIAPNTGNIIRLCANTGADLHLIEPLGFGLDDRQLRRAGLKYHELTAVYVHPNLAHFVEAVRPARLFAAATTGARRYDTVAYRPDDSILFGAEADGLPDAVLDGFAADRRIWIPMRPNNDSLNLANAASVVLYEAWRQRGFEGAVAGSTIEALRLT
jgi:tRNA (cytidine/uridine-2'-O-)-methyltransferase